MPSKSGMKVRELVLGPVDRIHVLQSQERIWLQARRNIAGVHEIANPPYKIAVPLSSDQARRLAAMLQRAAGAIDPQPMSPPAEQRHGKDAQ